MKAIKKSDLLNLVASLADFGQKRALITSLVENRELTEEDVAALILRDVEQNSGLYAKTIQGEPTLQFLWERFQAYPQYLARALVRARPDLFYLYGFAFRLVMKLKADLGPVLIAPQRPTSEYNVSVFMKELPDLVQRDLIGLDRECRFREALFFMSRDTSLGFEFIDEAETRAETAYERDVQKEVRSYCERLLALQFPDFVSEVHGQVFPSFHVRWWIDQVLEKPRVLNIGDTSTHKTAFSTIATHHYGCRRTLVLCPPHARPNWMREINRYFSNPDERVFLLRNSREVSQLGSNKAEYTVVGYSTLIEKGVVEALTAARFEGLIWDECHYGNNVAGSEPAQRATACATIIRELPLKRILALSATPFENEIKELGSIAAVMQPEVFPTAESFRNARTEDPRFVREFFAEHIVEVAAYEVRDLPPITPKPWEDLFAPVLIDTLPGHRNLYEWVKEDTEKVLTPAQKVARLLLTTTHPHKVQPYYPWTKEQQEVFSRWDLSTKLVWLKERVTRELEEGAKVVVATGIHVEGITRPGDDEDEIWVGRLLQEWFGNDAVLILDGTVSQAVGRDGSSDRDRLITRWRSDPSARILLVSMRACPDAVNLSVPALPGIKKLFITALCYPWVPWKQFLGRFWRDGQGVPVEYAVPVLRGTIDEALLNLVAYKWHLQQLFRAQVPLTEEEWQFLNGKMDLRQLAEAARSNIEKVNIIGALVRGRGEESVLDVLRDAYGTSTNGDVFARAFLATQDTGTSGNIARFMRRVITKFIEQGLVHAEGILDAGCGLLTLERFLDLPVYGVDLNSNMIGLARDHSNHQGKNACVGFLSRLTEEWREKFELTVVSLVLDWTSLSKKSERNDLPERLAILSELVRVTHPYGRIWITATEQSMDQEILDTWIQALATQGFTIVEELTGLVCATDHKRSGAKAFAFWSLCFTPNGNPLSTRDVEAFRFKFETERVKVKRGSKGDSKTPPQETHRTGHTEFEIVERSGSVHTTDEAALRATVHEVGRLANVSDLKGWKFHQPPSVNLDWRILTALQARGALDDELHRRGLS